MSKPPLRVVLIGAPVAILIAVLAVWMLWPSRPTPEPTASAPSPTPTATATGPQLPGNSAAPVSIALTCKAGGVENKKEGWLQPVFDLLLPRSAWAGEWGTGKPINADAGRDVHVGTLDGYRYDFQAVGEFVGLKTAAFELQMRLQPYASSRTVSIMTGVALKLGDDIVAV